MADGANTQERQAEDAAFARVADMLTARSGESFVSEEVLRHILTRVTDEGLVIELFDLEGVPLFTGSDVATDLLGYLATLIANVSRLVENDLALAAHVRARPVKLLENPVWDVSAARANRMRALLEAAAVDPSRMTRVTGHADRKPATVDPMDVRNNRIEVILLRSGQAERRRF